MVFTTVTFCAALLVLANAGPVYKLAAPEESACALTCSDNNKFNYQPETVYGFSYDAKTTTKMNGASEDSATINMNIKFEIKPITKCNLIMMIKDASLRDSEDDQNSQAFKEAMMKQPLKFSFQDGRIDHICAMDGESTWTLNIKRGILSAFQNSMDSFDRDQNLTETDVVGSCDSEYKILDEGRRTMLVQKTKNLLGCSDREGYRLAGQSIGYNVPSFVKSLPLMKSEYKCTQTLDLGSNILQSSTCSEEHVFRPFSYEKNGAMTSSEQTLTFTNKEKAGRSSNEHFSQRSTLVFHHQHDTPSKQEKEEKIEAKLQELCQKAAEDIRPEVPEMVNQLIEHMRQVDRDVLSKVYKKINQKKICAPKADRIKQYFHVAIPMVGTAASVGMIPDLISKKHVTGSEAEMWLLSLSFVHHPTKEMVAAAMPLLDESDVSGNTLLAVSSLASSYCNVRPDCGKDSEISALTRKLMDLTHDCNAQNGDARRTVFALRALGNIGHSHEAVSHLTRCATRRNVPEEIRIAAMDAFRRIPCDAMRSDLMGVFRDESEDSELRINAYITLMKCPSRKVVSEVRKVLEKEKSNQVGSFVWSHLTNLMETSDPHMQDIRNIVQDEELKKEFNLDQRKFSRNYEGSFFLDSINTGAKVDSNVIFSQKSFIPRSANLNLNIDLFGHAINFLEFGGRVQGMESILENFFRPIAGKEPKTKTKLPLNTKLNADIYLGP